MENNSKIKRCRYALPDFEGSKLIYHCFFENSQEEHICFPAECETCKNFDSKYIEYPVIINKIEQKPIPQDKNIGFLVEIQPCAEEYQKKTFLGIYLGNLPISISASLNPNTQVLTTGVVTNPAIFIPELKKIIYGNESWWRKIESIEDFKKISQEDIENTWYIKLLKIMEKE